jgi:hypothetical protein
MKIALLLVSAVLALVVLAGLILYLIGRTLPEHHTAHLAVVLPGARLAAWTVITDYTKMPEWWPEVKAVRLETRPNGEVWAWNKDAHGQEIAFRTKQEEAPVRLVREIMGEDLPFGGTWTFELAEEGANTRLTLTEDGFIKPPLFRAIAQYFIGLDKTMQSFATSLEKRLARAK